VLGFRERGGGGHFIFAPAARGFGLVRPAQRGS
jgi:hypothetical protein